MIRTFSIHLYSKQQHFKNTFKNTHLKRNITNFNIIKTPLSKKLYFRGVGITSELGLYIIVGFNGGFFNIRHFIECKIHRLCKSANNDEDDTGIFLLFVQRLLVNQVTQFAPKLFSSTLYCKLRYRTRLHVKSSM